ncbi:hypothetical protein D1BOALGB6SA_422 [Olavius sp. associated proteobacterium Delta 1]|nr:hypothetical protein D1BOALGB6SA_422 [Olavius sp. associated proteobacterium Delta 1]
MDSYRICNNYGQFDLVFGEGVKMKTGYLAFVGLYFLGLIIRTIYEQLKKAGRVNPKSILVSFIGEDWRKGNWNQITEKSI